MIGIFRTNNRANILVLLVYALVLKMRLFAQPLLPQPLPQDGALYSALLQTLQALKVPGLVFSLLSFILIFWQALLFNQLLTEQNLIARSNYLPAMTFILVTSLFPEWNGWSSALLLNVMLLFLFRRLIELNGLQRPQAQLYNLGLLVGLSTWISHPALIFVGLLYWSLFVMRPFQFREWLITALGLFTPFYFKGVYVYLTDQWGKVTLLPKLSLGWMGFPQYPSGILVVSLMAFVGLVGVYLVQTNLNKMLIQVRKSWNLLLFFLPVAVLASCAYGSNAYPGAVVCSIPVVAFHTAAYYFSRNKYIALILHWLTFALAIYVNMWI